MLRENNNVVAGGTAYWVTRRCSPEIELLTIGILWKVQIETSASCYSVMRIVSHYMAVYCLIHRFHGAELGALAVPQASGLQNTTRRRRFR